ncbi:MAG: UbiA family prenyltransferase [Flavobacteriales bacterium]|nr:UbiA family prenyltransferase [Flavobacteriales bacterium]
MAVPEGKYRLLKADKWWVFKIAGGLLTVILLTVSCGLEVNTYYWLCIARLFGAFVLLAIYGHLVNDISDHEVDTKAGKPNIVNSLGRKWALFAVLSSAFTAVILVWSIGSNWLVGMALLQIALNALYSLKPARLKERGVVSVLVTGLYERSLPYAMIGAVLLNPTTDIPMVFMIYLTWSYMWEVRNHLNGQLADMQSDALSGVRSLAVARNPRVIEHWMQGLFLFEAILFAVWMYYFNHSLVILVVAGLLSWYFHHRMTGTWQVSKEGLIGIVDDIYNFNLPVLFAINAAVFVNRDLWPIALVLFVGFDNYPRKIILVFLDKLWWKLKGSNIKYKFTFLFKWLDR